MRYGAVVAVTLTAILIFSVTGSAFAQQGVTSIRIVAKGSDSNVMLLVLNSPKSTQSVHQFEVKFTKDTPLSATVRGWDDDLRGNTFTFTTERGDLSPGSKVIFIIKVTNPASAALEWIARSGTGSVLDSGEVTKVRIREPSPDTGGSVLPPVTTPEISVNKVKGLPGEQITVSGRGYSPNSQVIVYLDQLEVGRSGTDASGAFNAVVLIPANSGSGLHMIRAVDAANKSSVFQILVEAPQSTLPPLQGGRLEVRLDKQEYNIGELIRITGSAVLERPVSLIVSDPQGGIVCGANPPVDPVTLLWDYACQIPPNAIGGRYRIDASQVPHKTTAVFSVKAPTSGSGSGGTGTGAGGEDPGTIKIATDKQQYKPGDTAHVTITGARPSSLLDVIVDGPGRYLTADRMTADTGGSLTFDVGLSGSESIGTWEVTAKQMDVDQKKQFIARYKFTVVA